MPFAIAIFVSAFLLFQVQPVIAKYILPWFGGGASVWSSCMLFFQAGLLGGYAYAHFLTRLAKPKMQAIIHFCLLLLALLLLPITPDPAFKPMGDADPVWGILLLLGRTVGIPYLLISATGPLLQKWFSYAHPGRSPYRLYALSNLGSLLGLLSYPFLVEPALGLRNQSLAWSLGFTAFALICGLAAFQVYRARETDTDSSAYAESAESRPGLLRILSWVLLAACGSLYLLGSTNKISQDVAVVPFLWIIPLSAYLISFIIAFDSPKWYDRRIWLPLFFITQPAMIWVLYKVNIYEMDLPAGWQVIVYCIGMFSACMVVHGELSRSRPQASQLTLYFLLISVGGAIGGLLVNFVVPFVFDAYWELHTTILFSWFFILILLATHKFENGKGRALRWLGGLVYAAMGIAMCVYFRLDVLAFREGVIAAKRNFYGAIAVQEDHTGETYEYRTLKHGIINHGIQYRNEAYRTEPTSYYGRHSGVGIAIRKHPKRLMSEAADSSGRENRYPLRVGMVGLGTGTIARYEKKGDVFRFYEINPAVADFAQKWFSYLSDAKGKTEIILGDGRIGMEREIAANQSQQYDVLAIDAFSGDAIPVHLLTREAFQIYFKELAPDGILAIHITNRYIDLIPVVRSLAKEFSKQAALILQRKNPDEFLNTADWILVTDNTAFLDNEHVNAYIEPWPEKDSLSLLWTDDYSTIVPILEDE